MVTPMIDKRIEKKIIPISESLEYLILLQAESQPDSVLKRVDKKYEYLKNTVSNIGN